MPARLLGLARPVPPCVPWWFGLVLPREKWQGGQLLDAQETPRISRGVASHVGMVERHAGAGRQRAVLGLAQFSLGDRVMLLVSALRKLFLFLHMDGDVNLKLIQI